MKISTRRTLTCAVGVAMATIGNAFTVPSSSRTSSFGICLPFGSRKRSFTSNSQTELHAKPLLKQGDWGAYLDEDTTGLVYYFNSKTGESLWEPPTDDFPEVYLSKDKFAISQEKYKEYRESDEAPGFFESILTGNVAQNRRKTAKVASAGQSETTSTRTATPKSTKTTTTVDEPPPAKKSVTKTKPVVVEDEQQEEPEKKSWFSAFQQQPKVDDDIAIQIETVEEDDTIQIDMSSYVLPHPEKKSWGGEDAVFTKGRTFGVFDGVSGAEKIDGVPLYSTTMATAMAENIGEESLSLKDITKIMTDAAEFADEAATGASTAVVGSLDTNGKFQVLNVGDSACIVIRPDRGVVFKTNEINHFFDCPYQMSEESPDRPRDGTRLNVRVKKGDVIVMGSDGIFDNLTADQIVQIVDTSRVKGEKSSQLARKIVNQSREVSLDETADTPYAKLAQKNGFEDYLEGVGGKIDDVACVVVQCK